MARCQAVYHSTSGTVYVSNEPVTTGSHEYRIYDYSMAKDTWNIIPTDFWRFSLASYNGEVVLVLKNLEDKNSLSAKLKIFPLTGSGEESIIGVVNMKPVASTVAVGSSTSDMLIVVDYNLRVFSRNTVQRQFSVPSPDDTLLQLNDVYFSIAFHGDCLYLAPITKSEDVFRHRGCPKVFYVSLNQIVPNSQPFIDGLNMSLPDCSQPRKRTRPTSKVQHETHKRAKSEPPPSTVYEKNLASKCIQLKSFTKKPAPIKIQTKSCEKVCNLEWKVLESIPNQDHSNIDVFGKRLITTVAGTSAYGGMKILAYSPTVECWLPVANTGDSIPHRIQETTILPLDRDHANQLMLIGGMTDGVPIRDVYKLHLKGRLLT